MENIDLILKKFQGTLTDKEEIDLRRLMIESKDYANLYRQLKALQNDEITYRQFDTLDVSKAWETTRMKAKAQKLVVGKKRRYGWYTAIAASVAIIVASGFLIFGMESRLSSDLAQGWDTFGQPGSARAYLVVNDGQELILDKENRKNEQQSQISPIDTLGILRYDLQNTLGDSEEHSLSTPKGGEYHIVLSDGTEIWLNADTKIDYATRFGPDERLVHLEGEAYFNVASDIVRPFVVRTNNLDVVALGTSFNVKAYDHEELAATLIEGKVEIKNHQGQITKLEPGFQFTTLPQSTGYEVKQVNTSMVTAWKYGEFIFENMELEDILKRISAWYHIDYKFEDEASKNYRFTGTIYRDRPLKLFLDVLVESHPVDVGLENEILILSSSNNNNR